MKSRYVNSRKKTPASSLKNKKMFYPGKSKRFGKQLNFTHRSAFSQNVNLNELRDFISS